MTEIYPTLAQCAIVATAFKVLLFPAYKSTDFEVHRNWLAITNSLPLWEWYYENTSEWTLDYPPFFAYFEWLLSHVAKLADPAMLRLYNLEHDSWQTVYFQRFTVILTEFLLIYALQLFVESSHRPSRRAAQAAAISILLSPGLLIIDHLHFQYNGAMYGILILSLVLARQRSGLLTSGLLFAALLCMKHIYLYLAPAYFVYLLRIYCLSPKSIFRIQFLNCLKLASGILGIVGVAFGPFALKGQMPQILSRLFPFSRGLCHAYWAPNVWALYSFVDRLLIVAAPKLGLPLKEEAVNSVTRGLVGDTAFAVLPEITPRVCFALTLIFQTIPLIKLFARPSWDGFIGSVTLCGYASFLFGWHVHEKAILLVIIPFSLVALSDRRHLSAFRPLAVSGHVSLFPLLFTPAEFPIKTIYTIFWLVLFLMVFDRVAPASSRPRFFLFDRFAVLYIAFSIPLILYCSLVHQLVFGKSYEFLPLMFTSSYSSIGVVGSWIGFMVVNRVLFKRKPVQFLQTPPVEDDSQEVWQIEQTGEVFVTYDEYLNRIDFYSQHRFICQITGHSGLTFFQALKSELAGAQEVDQAFPEALKGPVLRRVQFQTISRIDTLVDMIYDEFKADYYPGEAVTIHLMNGERLTGIVRDKARLGSKVLPDGTLTQPYSRYFTSIDGRPDEEAVVDGDHIYRDRKIFTKSVLRSFIKKTVTREAWNGAPWLVKHDVAAQYHIDTRVPPHLRYDNKLAERKQHLAQKRASQPRNGSLEMNGFAGTYQNFGPARLPELKPALKGHKMTKNHQNHALEPGPQVKEGPNMFFDHEEGPIPPVPGNNPFQFPVPFRQNMPPPPPPPPPAAKPEPPPPPPPPPKYPVEDLQLEPRDDYVRPALKFMCSDPPEGVVDSGARNDNLLMKSIGPLLETWDTLNVYCEIFKLDSFTFDDFVEALEVTDEEMPCQLFTEVHCAVLKQLVSSEAEGGKLQVDLPELGEEEDDDDAQEDSAALTPEPEPEPKPTGRATRSSLAKLEAERIKAEAAAAEKEKTPEPTVRHRAPEALAHFDWIESLKKREFQDGGWEMILVGLLHQLSKRPRQTEACEALLAQLAPPDIEPSLETVRIQYCKMDLNLRISALQILCLLTAETKAVRGYMEDCAETMTGYRKEKIEWQRNRKQAIEDLKGLNDQRKILLPENMPTSPPTEEGEATKTNGDVKMTDADESLEGPSEDAESDEDVQARRSLRRGGDRATERQRKREENERKKEAELAAKVPKQSKQFLKVVKDIQKKEDYIKKCEDEIAIIDNDLREADCARTRVLGKDRFWNRYYWFERNGMPYAGLPNSSTADAGYANGCIWVQGPDDIEREGYIDMIPEYQDEYKAKFKMTVPQRKKMEEGRTSVFSAHQWGYYSDPDEVDALLNWLDPRGFNELKLRKEILAYKDKIVANMENRIKYLACAKATDDTEKAKKDSSETKRMTTRTKAQPNRAPPQRTSPTAKAKNSERRQKESRVIRLLCIIPSAYRHPVL
ncbi:ALG6, ALG8 glycosyltransferase family-domain-containing protein [Xylariomycetidae sp. FL2044]|nr:ALG6, ALG8 glycosyltransferase family-domain-containing protein [Xylariomycetidae sp. FL2044]